MSHPTPTASPRDTVAAPGPPDQPPSWAPAAPTIATVLGPTLPAVVRRARFPMDTDKAGEFTLVRCRMSSAALRALPELAQRFGVPERDVRRLAEDIEDRTAPAPGTERRQESVRRLELALLQVKRNTLRDLRDSGRIDDIVLRTVQRMLDVEEVRLTGRASHSTAGSDVTPRRRRALRGHSPGSASRSGRG